MYEFRFGKFPFWKTRNSLLAFVSSTLFPPVRSPEATEPGPDAWQKPSPPAALLFSPPQLPRALIRDRIACRCHSVKVYRSRTTNDVPGNTPYTGVQLSRHEADIVPCGSRLFLPAIFQRRSATLALWEIGQANQDGACGATLRAGQEAADSDPGYRLAD